jgi:hypothetical protein
MIQMARRSVNIVRHHSIILFFIDYRARSARNFGDSCVTRVPGAAGEADRAPATVGNQAPLRRRRVSGSRVRKESFFGMRQRRGGRVLPGGVSLPYGTIGLLKNKFAEILEIFGIWLRRMAQWAAPSVATNRATGQTPVWTANSRKTW